MKDNSISADFPLSRIRTPITLHYSLVDKLADATDAIKLKRKLKKYVVYAQAITKPRFNHIDFAWGMHAAKLVYAKILENFNKINYLV